jgi:hypothetical protein
VLERALTNRTVVMKAGIVLPLEEVGWHVARSDFLEDVWTV